VTDTKKRPGKPWIENRSPHADEFVDEPELSSP